jgi:hypothetical protein
MPEPNPCEAQSKAKQVRFFFLVCSLSLLHMCVCPHPRSCCHVRDWYDQHTLLACLRAHTRWKSAAEQK